MSPFCRPPSRPDWRADRWAHLECVAVREEAPNVRTFLLSPKAGGRIAFDPGQFMTLRAEVAGETVERCYSISSSAAGGHAIEVTVKRTSGGVFSNHLLDVFAPGQIIEAFGPSGRFGPATLVAPKYALLAAGSGITPMLSIVRTAADVGIDLDAVFIQVARTQADLIAVDDWPALARRLPRLDFHSIVTQPSPGWDGLSGRPDKAMLTRLAPDLSERAVLCCGPTGFMEAMRDACAQAGVPSNRYLEESFDFSDDGEVNATGTGPTRTITFAKSGRSFDCRDGMTILQAAKAAGVPFASSCTRGICGTCKSLKLAGDVDMNHNGGIRDREIARGFILPCSSYPKTDVILDR